MKTASRKNAGAAENNRNEVRLICGTAVKYAEGIFVIKDRAGNLIYVDTYKGVSAGVKIIVDAAGNKLINCNWYEDGTTSIKANGYVYTPIVVNSIQGKEVTALYGTHSLVAMLSNMKEYDRIDNEGKTPIANHKNNKPWDNRASNLEWTTQGGNCRHGKIVASLNTHFYDTYSHIESNAGESEFIVLDQSLSVTDIERYTLEIDNSGEFKCEHSEYISEVVMNSFVDWLIETKRWKDNV